MLVSNIIEEMYRMSGRSLFMGGVTDMPFSSTLVFNNGVAFSEARFKRGVPLSKQGMADDMLGKLYTAVRNTDESAEDLLDTWERVSQYNRNSSLLTNPVFGFLGNADEVLPPPMVHGRTLELAVSDLGSVSGPDSYIIRADQEEPIRITRGQLMSDGAIGSRGVLPDIHTNSSGRITRGEPLFRLLLGRGGLNDGDALWVLSQTLDVRSEGNPIPLSGHLKYSCYNNTGASLGIADAVKKWEKLGCIEDALSHIAASILMLSTNDMRRMARARRRSLSRGLASLDISSYARSYGTVTQVYINKLRSVDGFDCQILDLITSILAVNMV